MTHLILFLHIYRIIFIILQSLNIITSIQQDIEYKGISFLTMLAWTLFIFSWYY